MTTTKITPELLSRITDFYNVSADARTSFLTINGKELFNNHQIWLKFGADSPKIPPSATKEEVDSIMSSVPGAIKVDGLELLELIDPNVANEFRRKQAETTRWQQASKRADQLCCDAFGILEMAISTSMDDEASQLAKKLGVEFGEGASARLGAGEYAYTVVTGQSIDDYEVMVVRTKGKREPYELLDFYETKQNLHKILMRHDWDLDSARITSWETGIEYKFWDIKVDASSAAAALKERVSNFLDSYGGD